MDFVVVCLYESFTYQHSTQTPYLLYQSDFQNLKTLTDNLQDQRNKRKLEFLLSIPVFSQLKRSVTKATISGYCLLVHRCYLFIHDDCYCVDHLLSACDDVINLEIGDDACENGGLRQVLMIRLSKTN